VPCLQGRGGSVAVTKLAHPHEWYFSYGNDMRAEDVILPEDNMDIVFVSTRGIQMPVYRVVRAEQKPKSKPKAG